MSKWKQSVKIRIQGVAASPAAMNTLSFPHPEPPREQMRLLPVFLPFAGCPDGRCIFCNQPAQTGLGAVPLQRAWDDLRNMLDKQDKPCGIGFFGGTFTGLAPHLQEKFLVLTDKYRKKGIVSHVRLSTRPDKISSASAVWLKEQGVDMVEFGIQTFSTPVLRFSGRGYDAKRARNACHIAREAGLDFGIQLLPGLPGHDTELWQEDILQTIKLRPGVVRIYPCLVLRETELARRYMAGLFQPWSLEQAVERAGQALLQFWQAKIRVIRLGLLGDLQDILVAGPWHPAFGTMARSMALFFLLRQHVEVRAKKVLALHVPQRFSGEIFGVGGANKKKLATLGVTAERIFWTQGEQFVLEEE